MELLQHLATGFGVAMTPINLLYALVGCLLGSLALRFRRRELVWQRRAGLARLRGGRTYRLVLKDLRPPWGREELDGIATVLDRLRTESAGHYDLDVPGSLLRTVKGHFPPLRFLPRRLNTPLLVLLDRGLDMKPWQRKIDALLQGLEQRGIIIRRLFFYGVPERVYEDPLHPGVELGGLLAQKEWGSIFVFSTGAAVLPEDAPWKDALSRWPRRVWVHPMGDPALFPEALLRLPVRLLPMTYYGMLAAAYSLVHDRDHRFVVSQARLRRARPVRVADVERLLRLVRLYPHATTELAEHLRQRFTPDIPEEVVVHLRARSLDPGSAFLQFPPAPEAPLSSQEVAAVHCLLRVVEDSRPRERS